MLELWTFALAVATATAATGFVMVAVLWLKKVRKTLGSALTEAAQQQVLSAQRMGETLAHLQKQQRHYEQQLHHLTQANLRLRQDMATIAGRLDTSEREHPAIPADRTLH